MADIRINSLPTTASASSSDDFLALDGATNGTRKLNAYSPTFGGNLTVSGTGSHVFGTTNTVTLAAGTVTATGIGKIAGIQVTGASTAATGVGVEVLWDNTSAIIQGFNRTGSVFTPILVGGSTVGLQIGGVTKFGLDASGNATLTGNLTVSGTGTSSFAGSLGIGTTSPTRPLDVRGSLGMQVNEDNAGTKVISIRSDFAGAGPAINVTTNDPLLFLTNNSERARITSAGNLGIGTTSPNAKLEIGLGSISGSETNQYLRVNASTYNSALSANLDLLNWGNNFNNSLGWRISAINSAGVTTQRDLAFSSLVDAGSGTVGAATERMRLFGTGNLFIGASPVDGGQKLQVSGTAAVSSTLSVGGNTASQQLHLNVDVYGASKSGGMRIGNSGNNYYSDLLVTTDSSSNPFVKLSFATHQLFQYAYGGGGNSWTFYTNNTTALTLDSSQNATFAGKLYSVSGTATTPAFSFTGDTGTGMYRSSAGIGALAASGSTAAFWANNVFAIYSGVPLRLGNAYTAGAPTATGYVTIQDSAGNTYKVLVGT